LQPKEAESSSEDCPDDEEPSLHSEDEASDNEDIFATISPGTEALQTPHGRWHRAVHSLVPLLRSDLTLPLEPGTKTGNTYTRISEGVFLPLWHCPFLHCAACWQSSDKCASHERDWWKHIWDKTEHQETLMRLLSEAHVQISSLEAKDSQRCWLVFVSHVLVGGEGQLAPYTRENNVSEHICISSEKEHVVSSFYIN